MALETNLGLTLFVKHGCESEAAQFYAAAFDAEEVRKHRIEGEVVSVDMLIRGSSVTVSGANPKRDQDSSLGGPISPKSAGAVTAVLRLHVDALDEAVSHAARRGASLRDPVQTADDGQRTAVLFDPYGHMWALIERRSDQAQLAA